MTPSPRFVERIIAMLKADAAYRIDSTLSPSQVTAIMWYRAWQLLRGFALRLRARKLNGPVFVGRRVVVEHASQLASKGVLILEDGAAINALSRHGIRLGRNVTVGRGSILVCTGVIAHLGEGIAIGDRSAIGAGSFLGGQGGIQIGNDVIMGPGVHILAENHAFADPGLSIRSQGVTRKGIVIGDDCWIGAGVTIVDGVTIGAGCVVGAAAVVTRDIQPLSVAVGSPARVIKSRSPLPGVSALQAILPVATEIPARTPSSEGTAPAATRALL